MQYFLNFQQQYLNLVPYIDFKDLETKFKVIRSISLETTHIATFEFLMLKSLENLKIASLGSFNFFTVAQTLLNTNELKFCIL